METKITPMMQQWHACKAKAPQALLLFRLGDFYEAFHEDAKILSNALDVTLTQRGDIPMSGIPVHTIDQYLDKLVQKGHLIAIAEQVEDPKQAKGIVKREIVRLLSPGTVYNSSLLSEKTANFFVCICCINMRYGLAALDLTTAQFKTIETQALHLLQEELLRLKPSEILLPEKFAKQTPELLASLQQQLSLRVTIKPDWHFEHHDCYQFLTHHLKVTNLDGFGLKGLVSAINAAGQLLKHIQEDLSLSIHHIQNIETYHLEQSMMIDQTTLRHLEIFIPQHQLHDKTLLNLLDKTLTPMGGRLLKQWISYPLLSVEAIHARLDATEELVSSDVLRHAQEALQGVRDLERLIIRISTGHSSPKDLAALKNSLAKTPFILNAISTLKHPLFVTFKTSFPDLSSLVERIDATLVDDPPVKTHEGGLIKARVCIELDELKQLKIDSQDFLIRYQETLKQQTGIKTLKVGFNRAFGYYIEISQGQASKAPPSFYKRQTLVNAERFITEELREYEHKILHAEEHILAIEQKLYQELKLWVISFESPIQCLAQGIAHLDCLLSLALLAKKPHYTKPTLDESSHLILKEARHPVIEASTSSFIPNDTNMNHEDHKMFIITGPNMAGKSTYIRQVALICIMAQIGCFVPASYAHIGIIDKIFSRIGASDDLARGQSTFMVEMSETANILRHATPKSLVILDEIGRGTSTYDGIAIAWSVAHYLLTQPEKGAKTLFATHYWELTELEQQFPGVVNYHIAVQETSQGIVFLRKILRGGTDKSYGIHVAKLAGLPQEVISKAIEILKILEQQGAKTNSKKTFIKKNLTQMDLFVPIDPPSLRSQEEEKIFEELKGLDLLHTTPLQALTLLECWKTQLTSIKV